MVSAMSGAVVKKFDASGSVSLVIGHGDYWRST